MAYEQNALHVKLLCMLNGVAGFYIQPFAPRPSFLADIVSPSRLQLRALPLIRQAALPATAGDLRFAANLRRYGTRGEFLPQLLQAKLSVAELAAGFAAYYRDSTGHVRHANRGIGRVHALATWPGRTKHLDIARARNFVSRKARPFGILAIAMFKRFIHAHHHNKTELIDAAPRKYGTRPSFKPDPAPDTRKLRLGYSASCLSTYCRMPPFAKYLPSVGVSMRTVALKSTFEPSGFTALTSTTAGLGRPQEKSTAPTV